MKSIILPEWTELLFCYDERSGLHWHVSGRRTCVRFCFGGRYPVQYIENRIILDRGNGSSNLTIY